MLRKHWKLSVVIVVACAGLALSIGALASKHFDREETVSIDQVPAAVRATLLAQGGTVEEIEMEMANGLTVYEADMTVDGQEVEVKVAPDGSLISKGAEDEGDDKEDEDGQAVSIDQIPDLVKATLLTEAQGGTIEEIELEDEGGQLAYEADVVIDGQKFELKIAPDTGALISKELDDEEDDDANKDD
jgi:uncharacterized membrane protein YkoI